MAGLPQRQRLLHCRSCDSAGSGAAGPGAAAAAAAVRLLCCLVAALRLLLVLPLLFLMTHLRWTLRLVQQADDWTALGCCQHCAPRGARTGHLHLPMHSTV